MNLFTQSWLLHPMVAPSLVAVTVVLVGAKCRPHPVPRRLDPELLSDGRNSPTARAIPKPRRQRRQRVGGVRDVMRLAQWCSELAGATRSGSSLSHAIEHSNTSGLPDWVGRLAEHIGRGGAVRAAFATASPNGHGEVSCVMVLRSLAELGGPPPEPLDRLAQSLRARATALSDAHTNSAQARLSTQVMTWLPVAMLGVQLLASPHVQDVMLSPLGCWLITAGLVCNLAGRIWSKRIITGHRATPCHNRLRRSSPKMQARKRAEVPDLVELVVLGIRSGLSSPHAVQRACESAPAALHTEAADVAQQLARGATLADALTVLQTGLGPVATGFVDAFTTADRYGLPVAPLLDRLAADVAIERRHLAELHARRLPIRLSFPLTVCVLPSFVLLAITPALLGAMRSLDSSLF